MRCHWIALVAVIAPLAPARGPLIPMPASAQERPTVTFIDSGQHLGQGVCFSPRLGDLDGDHDPDLFVTNFFSASKVWRNDGSGHFTDSGQSFGSTSGHGVDLGDLDGDDDLDAFLVSLEAPAWVLLNNGSGVLADTGQRLGSAGDDMGLVDLEDVDGDGDLDAVVCNYWHPGRIWLNDGGGHFAAGASFGDTTSGPMAVGDLDSDGDPDVLMMHSNAASSVWLNDGSGVFSDTGQRLGYPDGWGHASLGDLDGDQDLDAFATNSIHGNTIWLNDGAGVFTPGDAYPGAGTQKVDLGDADGDGDLDAFTTHDASGNKVWLNDASGSFTPIGPLFGAHVMSILAGDVDGDHDPDVVVGRDYGYGSTSVYFNTTPSACPDGPPRAPRMPFFREITPNPFDLGTRICYEVPAAGHVRLQLFDTHGRRIRTLVDGPQPAGEHSLHVEGGTLVRGLYFCRLELRGAGGDPRTAARKIVCGR